MTVRTQQLESLIQEQLNKVILHQLELPKDTLTTITQVDVSPDLSWATVYLSILPINKRGTVLKKFKSGAGKLQHHLNQKLHLRKLPRLRFEVDNSELKKRKIMRKFEELE